ncbi:DEKNAAC104039 [Brettanomyces naardenensis]|uniref:DEKNAAC104039 n=1 Tax=Brettanomyces naardenensis TaxID=13370 RepID=A0A448YQG5_BRENA|nr:DEKNAAC104039 [Brettanomyces naardenensis]
MTTFSFESSLPKLPLPELSSTISQSLAALQPLVSPEEFSQLSSKAHQFLSSSSAASLQQHLQRCSDENSNYLDSKGISEATGNVYGTLRGQTLPRNPFFILEDDPLKSFTPSQAFRASLLTVSALRFAVSLRQQTLGPDVAPRSGTHLTMESYKNLFGTTMVPHDETEGIGISVLRFPESRHIVVMARGQFYSLEVLSPDKDQIWFSKYELTSRFNEIIADAESLDSMEATRHAVGTFSTEMKPTWRYARRRLEETNPEQIKEIDSALFVVCLDHESPHLDPERVQFASHGTSKTNSQGIQVGTCTNRLYDKLCFVVTPNSVAACIYPAAIMDGTTVLRFLSDIYTDSVLRLARQINGSHYTLWRQTNTVPINEKIVKPVPNRIHFDMPQDLQAALHLAETRLADIISQHEYVFRSIKTFGESYIRGRMRLPADSLVQVCIQVTYYALYGRMASSVEPVTTRKFRNARTEPVTSQSETLRRLCQLFLSPTSDEEKWEMLLRAIDEHRGKLVSSTRGRGFERHLSALRAAFIQRKTLNALHPDLAPIQLDPSIPPFLFDPCVDMLYRPEILAANCGNPALHMFGITPAIPTGFGIGYIIKEDSISMVASSQWRQTGRFLDTLVSVLTEVKSLWKSVVSGANARKGSNVVDRSDQLQGYLDSIPMAMVASNHSSSLQRQSSRKKEADASILGGYDYFDVEALNLRSEMHSQTISRSNSVSDLDVGRKLVISEDL